MDKAIKEFSNVNVGDVIYAYDEFSHDIDLHKVRVDSIEDDKENICEGNPNGKTLYVTDLDCIDEDGEYVSDDYISVVTLASFWGSCA